MRKFAKIMVQYGEYRRRHHLRLWYRNSMNFVHEHYKKLNLVEFNANKKRKMIFYYKWRQAFLQNRKTYDLKTDGMKQVLALFSKKENFHCRREMCKWRDFMELRHCQGDVMWQVCSRHKQRSCRNAFIKWLAATRK